MADVLDALRSRTRRDGGHPMVTFVDIESGERTELSATSLENSAAKIANALRDEFDLAAGARVALRIPVHWQRAAWCAGVLVAGCVVDASDDSVAVADLVVAGPEQAVALTTRGDSIAVVSLHPFGLPITAPLPAGCVDVTLAVRQQPDAYLFEPPSDSGPAWLSPHGAVMSQGELLAESAKRAAAWNLGIGGRLLVGPDAEAHDAWLAAFVVPLAAGASAILVRGHGDVAHVAAQENPTARLG